MNNEKFTSAIKELRSLEKSLLVFATKTCESAQEDLFYRHKIFYLRIKESWDDVIRLQRDVCDYHEKGQLSDITPDSIHQCLMAVEIGFLVLLFYTKRLGVNTKILMEQVDLTRIAVCDFLGKQEYDIADYKEIYS